MNSVCPSTPTSLLFVSACISFVGVWAGVLLVILFATLRDAEPWYMLLKHELLLDHMHQHDGLEVGPCADPRSVTDIQGI